MFKFLKDIDELSYSGKSINIDLIKKALER